MTNIYIIRHAEAEGNIYRRIDGHYNSRITAGGYKQIAALQKRFENIKIDAVYASDLFRTCETAKAIYVPKKLPLHKDARFRETGFGVWEDLHFGWLEQFEPEQYELFRHGSDDWNVSGAEKPSEYANRFLSGLLDLVQKHDGQTIAIFTHGCVSAEALWRLFGEDTKKAGRCDNSGVSLLHYSHGAFSFSYLNDNSHLTAEISTLAHQRWWRGSHAFNLWFREVAPSDAPLFVQDFAPVVGHNVKVAMLEDRPAGYVSYAFENDTVTVSSMYLIPEFRHVRRGDQLLGIPVVEARARGCTRLIASVTKGNKDALGFFRRMGAAVESETEEELVFSVPISIPEY